MVAQPGFFDLEDRLARLSAKGDELERLSAVVDLELFRPELERAVPRSDRTKGGRPPFDHVLMFKVLILQTQNNLSDERTEFYLRDRLSWMRFLGLGLGDPVPDANTIWTFREALTKARAIEPLFALFDQALRAAGYLAMSGQLVDATIVAAPKQRNTKAEKQALREGRIPDGWAEKPAKLRHKDRDARWTVKYTKAKPDRDGEVPRRHRDPGVRVPEPRRCRSTPPADPALDRDRCRGACRGSARRAARSEQHGGGGLGGYRLSQQEKRGAAEGSDA